eukprot:TRINITY_DN7900_c0_g1_i1.p1 TRINITY_DN7900_c0_g1~~TRINITY_DN7900_c0_g1_i1.p1  ORF type:complete len:118 (+),score=22.98 TRINITY_DN7900_c0_g1_i1:12-365(+)
MAIDINLAVEPDEAAAGAGYPAFADSDRGASAGDDDAFDADDLDDVLAGYAVHVQNVPKTSSLSDVTALLQGPLSARGLGSVFCYRVSDSVVAVELESQVGMVKIPGEAVTIVPAPL